MMTQFFAPLAATGGIGLCSVATPYQGRPHRLPESDEAFWPEGEPAFLMGESEVRSLVAAIENGRPSDVIAIIKRQPWFDGVLSGVRATRHLEPNGYISL